MGTPEQTFFSEEELENFRKEDRRSGGEKFRSILQKELDCRKATLKREILIRQCQLDQLEGIERDMEIVWREDFEL